MSSLIALLFLLLSRLPRVSSSVSADPVVLACFADDRCGLCGTGDPSVQHWLLFCPVILAAARRIGLSSPLAFLRAPSSDVVFARAVHLLFRRDFLFFSLADSMRVILIFLLLLLSLKLLVSFSKCLFLMFLLLF